MMKDRRSKLLYHTRQSGYTAVAAFEPENVFYLTGFWGEAIAVCTENGTKLIAPRLEYSRAEKSSVDCDVIPTERGSELIATFATATHGMKVCSDCKDYSTIESARKQGVIIEPNAEPIFEARKIKDDGELKVIARAARILDRLYEICTKQIRVGVSERDLQARLVFEAMKMGANPPSYKSTLNPLIIASGPNGSLPHAEVTARKFRKGDMVVVDLTLRHAGYIADATRTFALSKVSAEMNKAYDTVLRSQKAGIVSAKAGAACADVDAACRDVIREAGYEKLFIHSTGHGIGLDVHEPPWLRMQNAEKLKAGMAVTVEPGVYLENKFGIRIEDSIAVTSGPPRVLNRFTKELIALG